MGKITVCNNVGINSFIMRYEEDDESIESCSVCDNLPQAKAVLHDVLKQMIVDLNQLKLKDIT